jgi:hypothetical protein
VQTGLIPRNGKARPTPLPARQPGTDFISLKFWVDISISLRDDRFA